MQLLNAILLVIFATTINVAFARIGESSSRELAQPDFVNVLVGYKNDNGRAAAKANAHSVFGDLSNLKVLYAKMPYVKFLNMQAEKNVNINFVEEDVIMTASAETLPWGITMAQGTSTTIPKPSGSSACSDPNSFKVAIVDSGTHYTHEDIPCNRNLLDPNTNCIGASFLADIAANPWYSPSSAAGHGTHVFGTIGATGGNGLGVASMNSNSSGICYITARVFDDTGSASTFYVYQAVDWAVDKGAKVINMSLGGGYTDTGRIAVARARSFNVTIIAAAGNSGTSALSYPASYDGVISVAAVDSSRNRASFSQFNSMVDIAAPGVGVLSTLPGNTYASWSGTSMATPHVTGAVTKIWSVCRRCTNLQVESCLLNTTLDLGAAGRDDSFGWGLVQAQAAYNCLVTRGCCAPTATTKAPTRRPTKVPTRAPTTKAPTRRPTKVPTRAPTTKVPTRRPTKAPTRAPATKAPTKRPTRRPTKAPTKAPSQSTCTLGKTGASCANWKSCCSRSCVGKVCR